MRREEVGELERLDATLFGYAESAEYLATIPDTLEFERTLCAFDGGRMVGSSAALSLELTVPGGGTVPMAGITWVAVLGTHRRRGLMRRLVTEQLARLEGGSEPVAGLGASQSVLYGRFGFGPATRTAHVEVETAHAAFSVPWSDPGSLEPSDADAAVAMAPVLHQHIRAGHNGMISRSQGMIRAAYVDAAREKDGAGPARTVVHRDATGEVDGLLSWRFQLRFDPGDLHEGEVRIVELLAASVDAETALWRFALDHDLARRVVAHRRPVDEAIADRLADPRRWTQRIRDDGHLRVVDVPALLAARRYAREDALTLEVRDPLFAWGGGRFRLEGGLHSASCASVDAEPDIVLGTAALGSIYLGDVAVERLWRAGLVEERTPGSVRRATAMFSWAPAPWFSYMF